MLGKILGLALSIAAVGAYAAHPAGTATTFAPAPQGGAFGAPLAASAAVDPIDRDLEPQGPSGLRRVRCAVGRPGTSCYVR